MPEPQPQFLEGAGTLQQRREQFLEKPLPSSEDAERAILGAILIDNDLISEVAEALVPDDFYSPLNRRVYAAMLTLFQAATRIDPILIGEELKKEGSLEAIGGVSTITNLTYGLPHFDTLTNYITIVQEKKTLRELIRACNQITSDALEEEDDTPNILDRAEQTIFNLTNQPTKSKPEWIGTLAQGSLLKVESIMANSITMTGVPTGLDDLDFQLGGLQKGDLIIMGARPSMGKTALALQIAMAGTNDNRVGLIFSLEMTKEQLIGRLICAEAKINVFDYQHGRLMGVHMQNAVSASRNFVGRRLFIDDTPAITPMQIFAKARRVYAEHKRLDFIVVDYLQLMGGGRTENRQQEVSQISRQMKAVAKELNVPALVLSQLSRAPEARRPPRPMLSDLRESGSIEQDADVVLMLYRDDYYHPDSKERGVAEIIVAKHRSGPTGTVKTTFLKEYTRFENLAVETRY